MLFYAILKKNSAVTKKKIQVQNIFQLIQQIISQKVFTVLTKTI